jgi:hypothetical protein
VVKITNGIQQCKKRSLWPLTQRCLGRFGRLHSVGRPALVRAAGLCSAACVALAVNNATDLFESGCRKLSFTRGRKNGSLRHYAKGPRGTLVRSHTLLPTIFLDNIWFIEAWSASGMKSRWPRWSKAVFSKSRMRERKKWTWWVPRVKMGEEERARA